MKEIVAPEIDPKSFGTFEKRAPGLVEIWFGLVKFENH